MRTAAAAPEARPVRPRMVRRIALAMLGVQAITFVVVIAVMAALLEFSEGNAFVTLEAVADRIEAAADADTPPDPAALAEAVAGRPSDLWAVVDTGAGTWMHGPVPGEVVEDLVLAGASAIYIDTPRPGGPIYLSDPAAGVRIVVGGLEPTLSDQVGRLLRDVLEVAIWFLLPLTALTAAVVPTIARRLLGALNETTASARDLKPEDPSLRLPDDGVPEEIAPLVSAFNNALKRLEISRHREARFLADAAHELRTPIAILRTRIDALPDDDLRMQLDADAHRLAHVADSLLDLQRLRSAPSQRDRVVLNDVVGEVCRDLAPGAVARGQTLDFDAPPIPVSLTGDALALRRAVTNLLANAIAYGGDGARIDVRVAADATVSVIDDGPGLTAAEIAQVTEPFVRGAAARQAEPAGAGLGLHIARTVAERYGGHLRLRAEHPRGLACHLVLRPIQSDWLA